ncbi:MAG: YMGG-like glycine zipper-containing protein [Opitutus sp.]
MQRFLDNVAFSQPYLLGLLPLIVVVLLMSGCATAGPDSAGHTRNFATTAATTAAGAYIGAKEGDGKAKNAAVGAAVGFVAGETINYFNNTAQREAFLAGYEKGQSNAVKQQYWIARDNQRPSVNENYEEAYYEIAVPQSDRDGVRREPTKRVIRVVMPREENGS